jgi:hypothetical protein
VRILVPYHKIKKLGYEEGLALYEAALAALPHPDRTLMHHMGLWIKNMGGDPVKAKEVLSAALATKVYPYTTRPEADEHIHTSLAATTLDEIDKGKCLLDTGKQSVLEHLILLCDFLFFLAFSRSRSWSWPSWWEMTDCLVPMMNP